LQTTSSVSAPTDHVAECSIRAGRALCPEKSTSLDGLPVPSAKAMARPAMARPSTGVSATILGWTTGRSSRAARRMPEPTTAAAMPIPIAHRNSSTLGVPKCGIGDTAKEKVPKPTHELSPMKIKDPTPAASSPGTSTMLKRPPPSPATSISRKAPTIGDPRTTLMAAKLPAAPMTTLAIAGASRLTSRTARTPRPLPIAISGASGPSTAPRQSVASAATRMPGSWTAGITPAGLNPSAGECPPVPGR